MRLKGCDMLKLSLRPCFSARQAPYCRRLLPRNQRPATTGVITIPISSVYLKNKDKEHIKMNHKLCKDAIESLSKQLYRLITARLTKAEREDQGVDFNGTIDSLVG
jgi:hypothetical protein